MRIFAGENGAKAAMKKGMKGATHYKTDEFRIKHDECLIKTDEFCIKNDGFCIKN